MAEIKIPHPKGDGTWVIFTEPTPRQEEILKDYLVLIGDLGNPIDIDPKDYPNDADLGKKVRELLTKSV